MGRPKIGDPELGREIIIETAIDLLKTDGLSSLSLSRIASRLNVKTPALYWYFRGKSDLYTSVSEQLFRRMLAPVDSSLKGRALLWAIGCALRAQQRSLPDAAKLASIAGVSEDTKTVVVPEILARIVDGGISLGQARRYLTAIQALSLGWSIFETNPATHETMLSSGDDAFEEALTRLIFGIVDYEGQPPPDVAPPQRRRKRNVRSEP